MSESKGFQTNPKQTSAVSLYDKLHLGMISLVHDTFYRAFVNPHRLLDAAGLKRGQVVLEVGCGPGFFVIPAAETIGKNGHLYTLDINPVAVEHVRNKVEAKGLTNTKVIHVDAAKTGLPDLSIDVAFLFGVIHSLKNLDGVLQEMHRVLKEDGILAVQKSSWSEKHLLDRITKDRMFHFTGREARIYRFGRDAPE